MSERSIHQYFGPSPRFDRACIEIRFPVDGATFRLASLEPILLELDFRLHEVLPDEPLTLDAAVCRLAGLLLARHKTWWGRHGSADGAGWAAIAYPFPHVCAAALKNAYRLITAGGAAPEPLLADLRGLSGWLASISKLRVWSHGAAQALGRDAITLIDTSEVYQIGHGAKGVHWYRMGSELDPLTGQKLEESKFTTVQLLRRFGLPTTNPVLVNRPQDVASAIARVGLPCVVKPLHLLQGEGVAPGLTSEGQVAAAVERALQCARPPVQIENHVEGFAYRLIVGGYELLWAYRRTPTAIVGDGAATVRELIERENRRRSRIRGASEGYLRLIKIDDALDRLLADRYGLELTSVIESGRSIQVVAQANIAQGAYQEDVTGEVHPDNYDLAIKVARLFRLRSMGIDFITTDISRSWKECPSAIIEVNRLPGVEGYGDVICMHRGLFPNRRTGCIPTIAVVGEESYRAQAAKMVLAALAKTGLRAGLATYSRMKENAARPIASSPGARAVDTLLLDPLIDAAVVLCEPDEVENAGLPLRRCDLALIEDESRFAWLDGVADAIVARPSAAALSKTIGQLAKTYADPTEGGPLPVIEPVEPASDGEFRVKVWRTRAVPRTWFWDRVGIDAGLRTGLTTHDDLLTATRALAAEALEKNLAPAFTYGELLNAWARVTFEAAIPLPQKGRDAARDALLAAVERVNAIAATKRIP